MCVRERERERERERLNIMAHNWTMSPLFYNVSCNTTKEFDEREKGTVRIHFFHLYLTSSSPIIN